MLLGAIADDITGATDLCLMLSREGMKTVQVMGVPAAGEELPEADAIVIALKSRTIAPAEAVNQSVAAARVLLASGAQQILFKYCSTFDSTDEGNIGPVAEALQDFVDCPITIACPSFPVAGRSVYKGHLFVGDRLLSESSLKDHPLTPMHDPDLVRVLQRQVRRPVGLIDWPIVSRGENAIRQALQERRMAGVRMVVVDTLSDDDLHAIGAACADMKLITGGSGIGMGLVDNFRKAGKLKPHELDSKMAAPRGETIILAGSCSQATRAQIKRALEAGSPTFQIDVSKIVSGELNARVIVDWVLAQDQSAVPVVFSSAGPEELASVQNTIGRQRAGLLVEELLAHTASLLQQNGFTRFIVAGGETSGAVISSLGVRAISIGPEIDPGVPWTRSVSGPDVALALKSGNFGAPEFFLKAPSFLSEAVSHA